MYPFRYSSIFKSRWMALLWAAGILWWAYDTADSTHSVAGTNQQASSDDVPINQADVAALQSTLNGAF